MAFNKKKSRPITVQEVRYRYVITTTKPDKNYVFPINLTIQREDTNGSCLVVEGLTTRNPWLDFSDYQPYRSRNYSVLYPKIIAKIISLGIVDGWCSDKNEEPYRLILKNEDVFFIQS